MTHSLLFCKCTFGMIFKTALLVLRCNFCGIAHDSRGDSLIVFASFYFVCSLILKGFNIGHPPPPPKYINSKKASVLSSSLKCKPLADLFFGFWHCMFVFVRCFRRRGGNISVNLSLFVLLYKTNLNSMIF